MPEFSTSIRIQCIVNSALLSCANNCLGTCRALIGNFIWGGAEIVVWTNGVCRTLRETKRTVDVPVVTAVGNSDLRPGYELLSPLHSTSIQVQSQNRIDMVVE